MKAEIKQVIFDLGGVLVEWNPKRIAEMFTSNMDLQKKVLEQIIMHPDWLELDRGGLSEQQAARKASARSGLSQKLVQSVYDTVRDSFDSIERTERFLQTLVDQRVPCYALSNMSVENYEPL